MGEENTSKGRKHFGGAIKNSLILDNSCGHFESRQVVVKSLPYAVCDRGGMGCAESSAMKIALVCAVSRLKIQCLRIDPKRNQGSEKCFLPLTPYISWDLNVIVFSIKPGI